MKLNRMLPILTLTTLAVSLTLAAVRPSAARHSLRRRENTKEVAPASFPKISELQAVPEVEKVRELVNNTLWQQEYQRLAASLGNNSTSCESPMLNWLKLRVIEMGVEAFKWLEEKRVFEMPFIYKALFDREGEEEGEYIGVDGAETEELFERHAAATAFWESTDDDGTLDTGNVKLLGVHGTLLEDSAKLSSMLLLYGVPVFQLPYWLHTIQTYIETNVPNSYNNSLFTVNALAIPSVEYIEVDIVPSAIFIGDGIIEFAKDIGLGRDGPDFVHAHEYGHLMQLEIDAFDDDEHLPVPEQSRRAEVMADALSAYFLAHDRGGNLPKEHVQQLHEVAFSNGDCSPENDRHHGTPLQRECAAMWGASQAVEDSTSGVVMHPSIFRDVFDTVLDEIVAVDAVVCQTVATNSSSGGRN